MKFVNRLFALLTQSPAPGFGRPGHAQLLRADRQAFMRLAETVPPPYHINAAGVLPLDLAFDQLHNDVTVTYHMLPVPLGRQRDDDKTSNAASTKTPPIKKTLNKTSGAPSSKGKGGGKNKRQPMPQQLHGMHHKTPSGKQSVSTSIWASARIKSVLVNMCAVCQGATRITLRQNMRANENRLAEDPKGTLCNALRQTMSLRCQLMMEQRTILSRYLLKAVSVLNCFAVTAGLTACIRTLLPDSFGIDHKVKHPKSQVICLDLQKPEIQEMVMQWVSGVRMGCQIEMRIGSILGFHAVQLLVHGSVGCQRHILGHGRCGQSTSQMDYLHIC